MEFLFLALEFSIFQDSLNHFSNNIRLQHRVLFLCHMSRGFKEEKNEIKIDRNMKYQFP